MKKLNLPRLILSVLVTQSAGIVGSFATAPAIPTWYQSLEKPFFTPPGWVFAPVWITLYALMGISFYYLWNKKQTKKTKNALYLFIFHLCINALWSLVFFGLHQIFLGLLVIFALLATLLYMIYSYQFIEKRSSILLYPYLVWAFFATLLNASIWQLNH